MKISQEMRAQVDNSAKNVKVLTNSQHSFDGIVRTQHQKLKLQELEQLMQDISKQGDKLARFRSFRDLVKFKRMVKGFLQETVSNGLDLKQSHSYSFTGNNRKLTIVKQVDEHLVELTEGIMDKEKKTVDLLGTIGEIKGLLINLYM